MRANRFELYAHGGAFDPEAFLSTTQMQADRIWRKGDLWHPSLPMGSHASGGFCKVLGDGTSLSLPEQERVAIEYLTSHREVLCRLVRFPGVTGCSIILQAGVDIHKNTVGFGLVPSLSLMQLALKIGIQPTYHCDVCLVASTQGAEADRKHLFENVSSLGDLTERIGNWTSFCDDYVYDHGGLIQILAALLDNMRKHSIASDFEEVSGRLSNEQREMLIRLSDAVKKTRDDT